MPTLPCSVATLAPVSLHRDELCYLEWVVDNVLTVYSRNRVHPGQIGNIYLHCHLADAFIQMRTMEAINENQQKSNDMQVL